MTKINKLVLQGFKSFAHRTELVFEDNFNVILGPNGSGKSNLGESICFVLGRLSAKSLRAERAANLLFNGGLKKKEPAAKAKVEIYFNNQQKAFPLETKEVVISRSISKKGTSTYRINSQKVTRFEVMELLAKARIDPDGYNIVLQGDINRFVEMHPLERRKIIEEIAGISVYEERRHKALLELEKVDSQLNEANFILNERKNYLKELKADRDQAIRFKQIKDSIGSYKASYYYQQLEEQKAIDSSLDKEISGLEKEKSLREEENSKNKSFLKEKKEEIKEISKAILEKGEKEQIKVHREIEDLKVRLTQAKGRVNNLKDELAKIAKTGSNLEEETKSIEEKIRNQQAREKEINSLIKEKANQQKEIEEKINRFRKEKGIEDTSSTEKEIEDLELEMERNQEQINHLRLEQQNLIREEAEVSFQLKTIKGAMEKVSQIKEEHQQQISLLNKKRNEFKELTLLLSQLLEKENSLLAELKSKRENLISLEEKLHSLKAKEKVFIEARLPNLAVQKIIEKKERFKGVHGTISQLGKIKKEFALALETTAGQKANFIVVDNEKTALDCLDYLKKNKLGTASFLPLTRLVTPEKTEKPNKSGVFGLAIDFIDFDSRFRKAFEYVFGSTLVVDKIDLVKEIKNIRVVSLEGDLAEPSGAIHGGYSERKKRVFFEDDSQEIEEKEKEIRTLQAKIKSLDDEFKINENKIKEVRSKRAEMEAEIAKLEKTLHLEDSDLEASLNLEKELKKKREEIKSKLEKLQREITSLNNLIKNNKTKRQDLKEKVSQSKDPFLLAQLNAFEETKRKLREEEINLTNEIKNLEREIKERLVPEKEKIKRILKHHQKEENQFKEELNRLVLKIKEDEERLKFKEEESAKFYGQFKELFKKREEINKEISKIESSLEINLEKIRRLELELSKLNFKKAEIRVKISTLSQQLEEFKNFDLIKNKSLEELQSAIKEFEKALSSISAVNLKALEVYERVEEEYRGLAEKKTKLEEEKKDVLKMMEEIEEKKKEQFIKTFDQVNKHFQKFFGLLFKKGKTYLHLENRQKPFDNGVEIKVKLTGQRYLELKSLSGGEKSLTALAFIFAIQEFCPSTFFIFDEIDAALDKQNSEKLSQLLKEYSKAAQYIIISHNDALISGADVLYGVSMDEFGVSKIVDLKV